MQSVRRYHSALWCWCHWLIQHIPSHSTLLCVHPNVTQTCLKPFFYIYIYYLLQHIVVSFEIIYSNLFGVYLLSAIIYLDFWICAGSICAFSMASLVCLLLWVRELKKKKKSTPVDNQKDIKCALCPPDQQHNQRVSAVCVLWETKTISRLRMGRH